MFSLKLGIQAALLALIFMLETFLPFYRGRLQRMSHALPNVLVAVINGLAGTVFFAPLLLIICQWSAEHSFGLLNLFEINPWIETFIALVLFDGWMYIWHRANHRIYFLWRFHRMHHSDPEMDVTTALRFHPGEIALSAAARAVILPLLGMSFGQLLIYELCLQPVILFHHSNIALDYKTDALLQKIMVTPGMHRVHHSKEPVETDSNYASIFSFWDKLCGTFRRRNLEGLKILNFGLREFTQPDDLNFWGMIKTPARVFDRVNEGSKE